MPAIDYVLALFVAALALIFTSLVGVALGLPRWLLPVFVIAALVFGMWAGLAFAPVQRGGALPVNVGMSQ